MLDPSSSADESAAPVLSRRRLMAGGGRSLLALVVVGTAAAACGPSRPPAPDPLEAQLEAARHDSELAAAAARAAAPGLVPALNVVAAERARHATVVVEELARAAGEPTPTPPTETVAATDPSGPGTTPAPPPTAQNVADALRESAESAAGLVPTLSGYRAGLMGSIAAACTASYTVGLTPRPLPPGGRPR